MHSPSILDLHSLSKNEIESLISRARKIKANPLSLNPSRPFGSFRAALVFFEASTRTRCSFEMACALEGIYPLIFEAGKNTSLEKGETLEDTLRNLNTYHPDVFVLRSGNELDFRAMASELRTPILNAGWGTVGHPSQALLDWMTILENPSASQNVRLVFVGDTKNSRVFSSHLELSNQLGYEVGVCSPREFFPTHFTGKSFETLQESLSWGTHFMFLRVQKERHHTGSKNVLENYLESFGASLSFLSQLRSDQFILHPGPVNYGIEIDPKVTQDPRCLIQKQAENGVPVRRALLRYVLRLKEME